MTSEEASEALQKISDYAKEVLGYHGGKWVVCVLPYFEADGTPRVHVLGPVGPAEGADGSVLSEEQVAEAVADLLDHAKEIVLKPDGLQKVDKQLQ